MGLFGRGGKETPSNLIGGIVTAPDPERARTEATKQGAPSGQDVVYGGRVSRPGSKWRGRWWWTRSSRPPRPRGGGGPRGGIPKAA